MRELLVREVTRLAFVEVYFGYGMHVEVVVTYFLGQVIVDNLFNSGVEIKTRKQPGLIFAYCCYCYCSLLLL
jgi:hypothetical protein